MSNTNNPREILASVRDFIRQPFAFPGGYPKVLVMHDGETLCPQCAKAEYRQISNATRHALRWGWAAAGVDLHMEGSAAICAHCGDSIESAYGDPESVED